MTQKDDLISRQAAIDALSCENPTEIYIYYDDAVKAIKEVSSAEPETHEKRTETHACDLISRQATIMHFVKASKSYECGMFNLKELTHELWQLPSAEPEIIRCKDCEYFHKSFCEIWSKFGTIQTRENGYCYMAEMRTDEDGGGA